MPRVLEAKDKQMQIPNWPTIKLHRNPRRKFIGDGERSAGRDQSKGQLLSLALHPINVDGDRNAQQRKHCTNELPYPIAQEFQHSET